jgi:hypothetical protein
MLYQRRNPEWPCGLFWAERPAVWFTQAEAQFTLAGISSNKMKFCHVMSQLDHWTLR